MSLRSRTNPLPPRARRAAGIAAFAVAYFLLAELGRALVAPAGVAVLWPVSGLYLGVLLAVDRRRWPMFGAAALLASVAANLAAGSTPTTSLAFALPSCAEGLLAAAAVERLAGGRVSFARGRDVVALVVGGAVAANALTALGGALVARAAFSAPIGEIWLQWWSANGLGMLALAPLIAGPVARGRRVRSKRRLAELALLAAGLAGAVLLVFGADSLTGGLRSVLPGALALPFLLWSGWRFGPRTTVVASLALAAAAGYLTVQDRGPFSAGAASAEAKVLALQAFLAVALVASLAFAAAAGERRRAQTLRERLRRALEAAPDAYVAIDHDGRVVDWSSRAEGLFGWSRDEALGRPLLATVVPESSQAAVAAALESEGRGDASVAGPVRFDGRRRTGEELSLEATLASTDGAAEGSHVFLRDVSERERLRAELVDARESKEHTEHALHDAAAERDRLAEALEGVRRGLDQTRADLAGVTAERDGLGERLTRSEAERERLRAALGRAESAGERLRGELERLDRERTELEQERARLAGEIELLARHLEERTHERDAARHGLEQSDRKGAQLSEELARAGEERAALRRDLELMAAKSDGLRVEAQKLAAQRDRLQQELEEASRQRDGLRSELETSHAERGRLEAKLRDAAAQHESLRQELRAGSARRRQLEGELGSVTARRQELEASLAASRQESEAIRHRLRRQTADQERLMQQLQREGEARGGAEQALDAMRRSLAELERERDLLAGHGGELIARYDAAGRFTYVSPAAQPLLGYEPRELLGRSGADMLHPEDLPLLRRARAASPPTPFEARLQRKDGGWSWVEVTVSPVLDRETGALVELQSVARPVGKRRVAEQRRGEAEARFEAAFGGSARGMALVGSDGRIERANAAFCQLIGHPVEQLHGKALRDLVGSDDAEGLTAELQRLLDQEVDSVRSGQRLVDADGRPVDVELSLRTVRNARGELVQLLAEAEDLSERIYAEQQLQLLADHDPLTGVFNRRRFEEELRRELAVAARYSARGAVLALDLDGFHMVNEALGRSGGDKLLCRLAEALRANLRSTDLVARVGGDQFAMLLPRAGEAQARAAADRVLEAVRGVRGRGPGESPLALTASVGLTTFGERESGPEELLVDAEIAMYGAKESGGDQVVFRAATPGSARPAAERLSSAERIRVALLEDRLLPYRQDVVSLTGGSRPRGELLVRLPGENGDVIPPAAFLPVAERFGLRGEIDRWLLHRAIASLGAEQRAGREDRLEVALSAKSLADRELFDFVARELEAAGAPAEGLCLLVPEAAFVSGGDAGRGLVRRLADLGCELGIDEFGARLAAFRHLEGMPFSYLKLAGELVQELPRSRGARLLVESVAGMARGLDMHTGARGVHDERTLALLREYGVEYAQGAHLAAPRPLQGPRLTLAS